MELNATSFSFKIPRWFSRQVWPMLRSWFPAARGVWAASCWRAGPCWPWPPRCMGLEASTRYCLGHLIPSVLLLPCPALVALLGKCPLSHMLEQRGWAECLDPQHSHLERQVLGKTCLIQLKSILQERNYAFCVVTACQIPMIGTSQNCFIVI